MIRYAVRIEQLGSLLTSPVVARRLAIAAIVLTSAVTFYVMSTFIMWYLALLLLLCWTPLLLQQFSRFFAKSVPLGVLFALLVLQSVHFSEHVAQMVQIHLLGWMPAISHGLFGSVLDVEWMHFFFDTLWIPINTGILLFMLGRRSGVWLWVLLPVGVWHGYEHVTIMSDYLRTGMVGTPGLLATGGHLWHNSPMSRPDLHFFYNAIEEVLIIGGFMQHKKGNTSWV